MPQRGDGEAVGESVGCGETLGETDGDGEPLGDGLADGDGDGLGLALADGVALGVGAGWGPVTKEIRTSRDSGRWSAVRAVGRTVTW
ncbi:MAG TPA: hypothetical protein VFA92_17290 [Candidatus Binatia bacterium]|nr:hypothetical protein [Candidatus Binatia bacterium]